MYTAGSRRTPNPNHKVSVIREYGFRVWLGFTPSRVKG